MSAGINAESARDGQRNPLQKESFLIPPAPGEKGQTVTMETLSSDCPVTPPLLSGNTPPPLIQVSVSGELPEVMRAPKTERR